MVRLVLPTSDNVATKVVELRQLQTSNDRLRAEAEAGIAFARERLKQIDTRLTEIGIVPDNVDQELRSLEEQFGVAADLLKKELLAEAVTYNEIISKFQTSLGEKK